MPNISGGIFAGLSPEELASVSRLCRWRDYAAGAVVLTRRQIGPGRVLFIQSGQLRAQMNSSQGREVIFRSIGPGEIVGDYAAIDGQPRSADVLALEDSLVAQFPAEVFLSLLQRYPSLALAELRSLTANIRMLTDRVAELSTLAMSQRLHAYLLRLATPAQGHAAIARLPSHAEIAAMIGSHREAVTKELKRLERAGVIGREGKAVVVRPAEMGEPLES